MGKLLLPILLFIAQFSNAQSPESFVKLRNPNLKYLEHLIKIKIDSIRERADLHPLANDSILYVSTSQHAEYCAISDKSTHHENDEGKETPEARVETTGGHNYLIHELLGDVFIHRSIQAVGHKVKPGDKVELKTYGAVASYIIYKWANDPRSLRNINNSKFDIIGCSAKLNKINDHMMIVCVLGRPYLRYHFTEYKRFFPYSKFKMYPQPTSFKEAKSIPSAEYPDKLKVETVESHYADYKSDFMDIDFKVVEEKGKAYLETKDIDQIKRLFAEHKNGLILELVDYETFHSGNPEYYMKPSKRNNKSVFSGQIINPRYGELILNGVNGKRKTWRLFMGQVPKVNGYYEWNLWLICNKKICMKRHFDTYCGDGIALYESLVLKENLRREPYEFSLDHDTEVQRVDLDGNVFKFDQSAISQVKAAIENRDPKYDYTGIKLKIINSIIPLRKDLRMQYNQSKKALLDSLKNSIYQDINVTTIDTVDLEYFNNLITQNQDSALMNLPYSQLIDSLKKAKYGKKYVEDDWRNRYAIIEFVHSKDTLKYLLGELREHLHYAVKHDTLEDHKVLETEQIQHYLFQHIERNNLDPKILLEMNHIATRPELARVINNQAWYEYEVIDPTHQDEVILKDAYKKFKYVALDSIASAPIYRYNHFAFSINHWGEKTYDRAYRSGKIRSAFKELRKDTNIKDIDHIERVYDLKAAHYYAQYPTNSKAIRLREKMVDGIEKMYSQSNDKDTLARLASILVFYGRQERAFEILNPIINAGYKDIEAYKLYLKLAFEHAPPDLDDINYAYYIKLMSADEIIGVKDWCDLFVGPCNISFQAFEYEPLRKKYCEKCAKKGNYATKY